MLYQISHWIGDAGFEKFNDKGQVEADNAVEALKKSDSPGAWEIVEDGHGGAYAENPEYKDTRWSDLWEATQIVFEEESP